MKNFGIYKIFGNKAGFTLTELLVTMFILAAILGAVFSSFITLSRSFKMETKSTETQIENLLGLELLRYDLEMAGYGLPESSFGTTACTPVPPNTSENCSPLLSAAGVWYAEAANNTAYTATHYNYIPTRYTPDPATFNDQPWEPRAIILSNNTNPGESTNTNDDSDVLIIKSLLARRLDVNRKWTVRYNSGVNKAWSDSKWDFNSGDRMIVLSATRQLQLGSDGVTWQWMQSGASPSTSFYPTGVALPTPPPGQVYLLYGIDTSTSTTMPFNRVDYYLQRQCPGNIVSTPPLPSPTPNCSPPYPKQCHPSSYSLYRGLIDPAYYGTGTGGGYIRTELPIMDCVMDFQVALGIDIGTTGTVTWRSGTDTDTATALKIRNNLKQVKVFILTHEGQYDPNFTYGSNTVTLGDAGITLKTYDLTRLSNWQHYRWKVVKLNIKLNSL
ncbi:MAG: prepilin-type N-terminal cleavage/methylation domain-containing protein [Nitrospirae bacterium]|nr:prepilin-type N-terminal cleavage/methylation domain-containing protein [Nitrospirota bacterium]